MVAFSSQVVAALLAAGVALAMPVEEKRQDATCTNPIVRKAWHTLTDPEKKAYLDAELCLMSKPSVLNLRGSKTRFDDFQVAHAMKTEIAHFVGQFLPFHRLFVSAHEQALRKECGYTGAQPYWEETRDAGAFSKSVVLDPIYGFGGDGVAPDNCIADGPFANYTNSLGPGYLVNDHCIDRDINDRFSNSAAKATVDRCLGMETFITFWPCIEGGPHGAGHGGIGAQMVNPVSSPGDPIFFLHHTWLDWLWAKWQAKDPEARHVDVGGNNKGVLGGVFGGPSAPGFGGGGGFGPPGGGGGGGFAPVNLTRPNDVPYPLVVGDPGNTTTLSHLLYLYGIIENRTIAEVMDTKGALCYVYDLYDS
ncbi:hypothetical protein QBC34DRAFT_309592 [Podospora aff. communis PSN243]|uniref:Tyrosinase copper-binding domain-containing protein n=1 Tax=Podospora aff. communis PSN243 TaxID=3040156 RepID=A0AAV9G7K8_9PEZI|nr:hypothetical protein QBC34DRAFT_309592 [Podospora aff. communis PSN243]